MDNTDIILYNDKRVVKMIFYEINLMEIPIIQFALSVNVEKHKNRFEYIDGFIEICLIEEGTMVHKYFDGRIIHVKSGMLSCITSLEGFDCHSNENEKQCHTTVGVYCKNFVKLHNTDKNFDLSALKERIKQNSTILLPSLFELEENYDKVLNIIKNISRLNLSLNYSDKLKAIGDWYELVGILTDITLKKLDNSKQKYTPFERIYVDRAVKYINERYMEKITIAEIAQMLEISEGYLQRIFKNVKGISIILYINNLKVNTVISLIKNRKLTLKEASYNVGIEDPSYMSRLFKKVIGMSAREYLKKTGTMLDAFAEN